MRLHEDKVLFTEILESEESGNPNRLITISRLNLTAEFSFEQLDIPLALHYFEIKNLEEVTKIVENNDQKSLLKIVKSRLITVEDDERVTYKGAVNLTIKVAALQNCQFIAIGGLEELYNSLEDGEYIGASTEEIINFTFEFIKFLLHAYERSNFLVDVGEDCSAVYYLTRSLERNEVLYNKSDIYYNSTYESEDMGYDIGEEYFAEGSPRVLSLIQIEKNNDIFI